MLCKYFLPTHDVSFHPLKRFFFRTKVFNVEDIQSFTIKCDVSCRLKKNLHQVKEVHLYFYFWRVLKSWMGVEFCQVLFLYVFTWSNIFLFYCIIMVNYNDWFLKFKPVLHSCIKSTWSWCIILILHIARFYYLKFWFCAAFMRNIGLHLSFLVVFSLVLKSGEL